MQPPKLRMAAVAPAVQSLSPAAAAVALVKKKMMVVVVVRALVENVIEGPEAVPVADSTAAATAVIRPFWGATEGRWVTKGSNNTGTSSFLIHCCLLGGKLVVRRTSYKGATRDCFVWLNRKRDREKQGETWEGEKGGCSRKQDLRDTSDAWM
jgi:hypothetical protein